MDASKPVLEILARDEEDLRIPLSSARGRWILAATIIASGMVFLDGTVVNVALPAIQANLSAPLAGLQWVIDAYALFLAALLLVGGALGDIYGRKLIFVLGLVIFTLASAGCSLAPNLAVLIAARALQGIGSALLVPGSLAMIQAIIAPQDTSRAIGIWTGLSGTAAAVGPVVGGYLIQTISWRTIFFLNVPLAIITLYATLQHVPPTRDPEAARQLDWLGALATIVGLGGVTYGLIEGPDIGWQDGLVRAALIIGIAALLIFPLREARTAHPMVPLGLFRSRNFSGSNLVTLAIYFTFYGALLFVVLYLQQVLGYTPLEAGAILLPISLLLLLLSPRVGALMSRFGARLPMTIGPLIIATGFFLFLFTGRHTSFLLGILPPIVVMGLGMSIFITPLTATVMGSVPHHQVGVASGVNNAVSRVASVLAIAVLGVVVAWRFDTALSTKLPQTGISRPAQSSLLANERRLADDPIPRSLTPFQRQTAHRIIQEGYVDGFHWIMGVCVVLCLLSALASMLLIQDQKVALDST